MACRGEAQLQTTDTGEQASNPVGLNTWNDHVGMVAQATPKTLQTLWMAGRLTGGGG